MVEGPGGGRRGGRVVSAHDQKTPGSNLAAINLRLYYLYGANALVLLPEDAT